MLVYGCRGESRECKIHRTDEHLTIRLHFSMIYSYKKKRNSKFKRCWKLKPSVKLTKASRFYHLSAYKLGSKLCSLKQFIIKVTVAIYSVNPSLVLSTFATRHLRLKPIVQLFCKKTTACHGVLKIDCTDCQSVSLETCCLNNRCLFYFIFSP